MAVGFAVLLVASPSATLANEVEHTETPAVLLEPDSEQEEPIVCEDEKDALVDSPTDATPHDVVPSCDEEVLDDQQELELPDGVREMDFSSKHLIVGADEDPGVGTVVSSCEGVWCLSFDSIEEAVQAYLELLDSVDFVVPDQELTTQEEDDVAMDAPPCADAEPEPGAEVQQETDVPPTQDDDLTVCVPTEVPSRDVDHEDENVVKDEDADDQHVVECVEENNERPTDANEPSFDPELEETKETEATEDVEVVAPKRLRVVVPVALNYVARPNGEIVGLEDGAIQVKNTGEANVEIQEARLELYESFDAELGFSLEKTELEPGESAGLLNVRGRIGTPIAHKMEIGCIRWVFKPEDGG